MARFIAFARDPATQAALLARLTAHAVAGTIDPGGLPWTGRGGTPAGCIAADGDPMVFEAATGYPACLGPFLDFLCTGLDPAAAAAAAKDWLGRAAPGADLSSVPGRILAIMLAEAGASAALAERAPQVAQALGTLLALHRQTDTGAPPTRAAWSAARAAALAATDVAEDSLGRTCGELAEAAAWNPLTSRGILVEVASCWSRARGLLASAATGWRTQDDDAVAACYEAFRQDTLARGEQIERTAFPPYFRAQAPELAQRFSAQLDHANRAVLGAHADLLRASLSCLADAPRAPIPATA